MLYQKEIEKLETEASTFSQERYVAKQLLELHKEALKRDNFTVLELGVDKGHSTRVFLNAADQKGGRLVSVDIVDCSNVAESKDWTFVEQDSADCEKLLSEAPFLKDGIDILYVDSLHEYKHVKKEIFNYFPYMKKGGVIFFDDVDSTPYMLFQRKDNLKVEIANRKIQKLLDALFISNIGMFDYSTIRGSTGLSRLDILCPMGSKLEEPYLPIDRNSYILWFPWWAISFLKRKIFK